MSEPTANVIDLHAEESIAEQLGFESTSDFMFVVSDIMRLGFDPEAGDFTPAAYEFLAEYGDDIKDALQEPVGTEGREFHIEHSYGTITMNVDNAFSYETSGGDEYSVSLAQLAPLFEEDNGPALFAARVGKDWLSETAADLKSEFTEPSAAPDLAPGQ